MSVATDQVDDARGCEPHRDKDGDKLGQSEIQFLSLTFSSRIERGFEDSSRRLHENGLKNNFVSVVTSLRSGPQLEALLIN